MIEWLAARWERLARPRRHGGDPTSAGRLTGIFVADAAGAPMRACDHAQLLVDRGLADDHYANGQGFWRLTDVCNAPRCLAQRAQTP